MDEMEKMGIKQATLWFDLRFNSKGQPQKVELDRVDYFSKYESGAAISDPAKLEEIKGSGLEKQLAALGLKKARHGFWVDLPRQKPHPFTGKAHVEFFDDPWLPVPAAPIYYIETRK
jgi:hypothetical protein